MASLDLRASRQDIVGTPGNVYTVDFTWPADELDGTTWTATIGGDPVTSISVIGDILRLIFTMPAEGSHALVVTDTTTDDVVRIGGTVRSSTSYASSPTTQAITVTGATATSTVTVVGGGPQGPTGPQGPEGPAGDSSPFLVTDAVGDGVTDDRAAIQTVIDAASAAGGGIVVLAAGTFLIKRPLWLPSKVTLAGVGRGATTITRPSTVKTLLTANAAAGATSVTVTDATGFEVGGPIHLSDTTSFEWLSTQGTITGISGNTITFTNAEGLGRTGLDGALQTARSATAYTSFPMLRNVEGSTEIVIRDLTLDGNKNANDPTPGTNVSGINNAADFTIAPIHWVETYYSLVENVEILNAPGDAISDQANDATGVTPTAALIKKVRNTVRGCRIDRASRHAIHIGSCHDGAIVEGNEIVNCGWYAVFFCAYATFGTYTGNVVEACGSGFAGGDGRDTGNVIANNVITSCDVAGIEFSGGGTVGTLPMQLTISGNSIVSAAVSYSQAIKIGVPDAIVTGNGITMGAATTVGVSVSSTGDRAMLANNLIQQATAASGSKGFEIIGADDVHLHGNILKGMQNGINVQGCLRLVGEGNAISGTTARTWYFNGTASTDCLISAHRASLTTISEDTAPVRLVFNGLGTNGTTDPASGGNWNSISGAHWNGTMVRWNSGGGEKVSIFYNGVGWTVLN